MLSALDIDNVLLIERLSLEFESGLVVLTGETGAGKSILLDALGLALGARADSGLVRQGAESARVSAAFAVPEGHPVRPMLRESEIDVGDDDIILRRRVKADGGSRAWINDQPVSAALLREAGGLLVEIHGQHDERGLLNPKGHRRLLDEFGGLTEPAACAKAYSAWQSATEALAAARKDAAAAAEDRDFLDHAIAELAALAPAPGEEVELARERADMLKGQKIAEDLAAIDQDLQGSEGGFARLRTAARRLQRIADVHGLLGEALAALDRAILEAAEAEDRLADAAEALSFDEARLDAVETRLFDLRGLARKHRIEPDALATLLTDLEAKRARGEAGAEELKELEAAEASTRARFVQSAEALHNRRAETGAKLDRTVAAELAPLKLEAARFRTVVEALAQKDWGPAGGDRVLFEVSTNPGAPFGPLIRIASGGELSRFILALKVALAETGSAGTMIFDEVDRGVGGAAASAIGERLARLARDGQVLVVTHSPQVAARGASHYLIRKSSAATGATSTSVDGLDARARREEIARMLSGAEITQEARAQAERLIA